METNEKTIAHLNSLIEINNDRIEGYETAAKETDDAELKSLFIGLGDESRAHRSELISEVIGLGGSPAEGTTTYRVWRASETSKRPNNHGPDSARAV